MASTYSVNFDNIPATTLQDRFKNDKYNHTLFLGDIENQVAPYALNNADSNSFDEETDKETDSEVDPNALVSVHFETEDKNLFLSECSKNEKQKFKDKANSRNTFNMLIQTIKIGKRNWAEHLIYALIALSMTFSFGHSWAYPDALENGQACNTDRGSGGSTFNKSMCDLESTLQNGQRQLHFLTPLVLGGFIIQVVTMWRTRRTAYCALCGAVRNINIQIGSLLPIDTTNPKLTAARKILHRWSVLGYELSVLKARGMMDLKKSKSHLETLGLLAPGEWELMVAGDRHTTVWFWLQLKSVKLREDNIIKSDIHIQLISQAVTLVRDKANDLMSVIDRDQPFPYASLCGILVNVNLFLNALWKGMVWSQWYYEDGIHLFIQPKIYVDLLILILASFIFGSLYDLCHTLYNPFGPRSFDVPHITVGGGMRRLARTLARGQVPRTARTHTMDKLPSIVTYYVPNHIDGMHCKLSSSCA